MNPKSKTARPSDSPRNLADRITHQLRRDIVEGAIKPGTALGGNVVHDILL